MNHFLDTVETIEEGLGFSLYDIEHLTWLGIFVLFVALCSVFYRKADEAGKARWRKGLMIALIADELWKMLWLTVGGNYEFSYLPLHLCSINIFLIAYHALKSNRVLGNYLYTVGIPGALAAMLFPTWTELPAGNFMYLHSFTVHILLAGYPLILTLAGDIKPDWRQIPRCLLLLLCMAVPIYGINLLLDTNFMFLMSADPGNPLYIFEQLWGNHLLGFPIIIAGVLLVMHGPWFFAEKVKAKKTK